MQRFPNCAAHKNHLGSLKTISACLPAPALLISLLRGMTPVSRVPTGVMVRNWHCWVWMLSPPLTNQGDLHE